jgi:hypothetical protein
MKSSKTDPLTGLLVLGLLVGLAMGVWAILWLLWNNVIAATFGWPEVGYWKFVVLFVVISIFARCFRGK